MSIRKVKGLESDFTIVPNQTINDKLSWAARGMLLYLCSKPDDWEVNIEDLIKQTTGSAKRSGRDAVRKIMDELIECGYMRKAQNRISGKFSHVDHEVSFAPFTENPYTVKPSTANTEQQSKDITKERVNKGSNTDIKQSLTHCPKEFSLCMKAIEMLKQYGDRCYIGKLRYDEWEMCELTMSSCEDWDFEYLDWFMQERAKSFSKKPSLPNMLADVGGDFQAFYDKAFKE